MMRWMPRSIGTVLSLSLILTATAKDKDKQPATIKDLDAQPVQVQGDPPKNVDAQKTMDSYKRFLDLNAGDDSLRAEAMRRLGDLNLESSEAFEQALATNADL